MLPNVSARFHSHAPQRYGHVDSTNTYCRPKGVLIHTALQITPSNTTCNLYAHLSHIVFADLYEVLTGNDPLKTF